MIHWPESLVNDIARRRAIIMVGSGVSRHSTGDGEQKPSTWRGFLGEGLALCNPKPRHISTAIKNGRYLDACEWLKRTMDEKWVTHLKKSFVTPKFKPAEIHSLIYKLDSRIVLTPNFDKIYENYAANESQGTIVVKKQTDTDISECMRRGDRLILKAHGSIDDPNNLIFTRKEYAKAREQYGAFYRLMDALFMTHTVLMLGVGLDDPDFQLLFENQAAVIRSGLPHYMTTADKLSADETTTLRETRNIKVLSYSPKANHIELGRILIKDRQIG